MSSLDLGSLRFIERADVFKAGELAAYLQRMPGGSVEFGYTEEYIARAVHRDGDETRGHSRQQLQQIATTLPLSRDAIVSSGGSLPAFFSGMLPEGRRLSILRDAVKTSLDDELTLLLAVGSDLPGDVQVVTSGSKPEDPRPIAEFTVAESLDFEELADNVDAQSIAGVQRKFSASMISMPVASASGRYILKIDPPEYAHLVVNESLHLSAARRLKLAVSTSEVVHDSAGRDGLLVTRFDRVPRDGSWLRLPLEDATQVLDLPPSDKYRVSTEAVIVALADACTAPSIAKRNLYLQFVFAWLTGNGDLHAKNVSVLGDDRGGMTVAPMYDVLCTLVYGDDTLALPVSGKTKNLRSKHWADLAAAIGLPARAAESANALALRAATSIDLATLPFTGSRLNGARRELGFRRSALAG